MANAWKYDRAKEKIDKRIDDVRTVTIVDWTRDTSLESIPTNKAYQMDAVHLYVEIPNLRDILESTDSEGTRCHQRTLRFLNLHYRAVERILAEAGAIRVDFHNQRLHAVIAKPYGDDMAGDRVIKAVAIAQLVMDVLAQTGDDSEDIPNADVRTGIDTGLALAVINGRNGYREPLFLGRPANRAAKLASNGTTLGIFLTNDARASIDLDELPDDEVGKTPLTAEEIAACEREAALDVGAHTIVESWRDDNAKNPIGAFAFTRSTPPLRNLDITLLSPGNSRRMDTVSVYADIDNFTDYVDAHIDDDKGAKAASFAAASCRTTSTEGSLGRTKAATSSGTLRHPPQCEGGSRRSGTARRSSGPASCETSTASSRLVASVRSRSAVGRARRPAPRGGSSLPARGRRCAG